MLPHPETADQPIIGVMDCVGIELSGLDLVSFFGPAVVADGTDIGDLKDFAVNDCRILARTYAIRVNHGENVVIARNRLQLIDTADGRAAIQIRADGARIERNFVGVWPAEFAPGGGSDPNNPGISLIPTDPCADPKTSYVGFANLQYLAMYAELAWVGAVGLFVEQPYRAWGGIHVLGGTERINIVENNIEGGQGHGVTLGGVLAADAVTTTNGDATNAPPTPTVSVIGQRFTAYVQDGQRKALAGIDVYLTNAANVVLPTARASANGLVDVPVQQGTYTVTLVPGYAVVSISIVDTGAARVFVLVVRKVEVEFSEDEAFLYQVTIQHNDIARMALSGIGFRRFDDTPSQVAPPDLSDPNAAATLLASLFGPRELIGTCNVIRDLIIRANRIHNNLRAVFTDLLIRDSRTVGQGGISLGLVENALIVENEVLDNGRTAVDPVCGVFVGYGEDIEIRDNRIAGNGPVLNEDYETQKLEGLRGGVFIRLASALLVGGQADAQQKPALRISGNYIDQPAGRPITAFAFGPVACVNNYLNSERTGRWSIYDTLVGGVMILNVGGIQRQTRVASGIKINTNLNGLNINSANANANASTGAATGASAYSSVGTAQAAELLLPGGEVLYNSNQLRIGTNHKSAMATFIVTLDDLGFDGNQSTVLRPDLLVTNALCLAFSLRATDNRFRERTRQAYFSLVTIGYGLATAARLIAMNTTANNQGDHCIIPLSNGSSIGGLPVIDDNNLEITSALCKRLKEQPALAQAAVLAALISVLVSQSNGNVDASSVNTTVQDATVNATTSVQGTASQYRYTQAVETARLTKELGPDDPRVVKMQTQLDRTDAGIKQLNVETQLAAAPDAAVPQGGVVVNGRITDTTQLGRADVTVELAKRDGTSLGVTAKTDEAGNYTMSLDAATAKQLAGGSVYVQAKAEDGTVLQRTDSALSLATDTQINAPLVLGDEALRVVAGSGARRGGLPRAAAGHDGR